MKTKSLLTALALPLIFGACSNDEFLATTEQPAQNGDLVEVGPNFVIAGVKGDDAATRGQWVESDNQLNFLWIPKQNTSEAILDKIGICWIGNAASDNVYTNYEFIHNGWLAKNETAAKVDPCNGYITNGYNLYNVSYGSNQLKNEDSSGSSDTDLVGAISDGKFINITATTENNKTGDYNLASAFFRTSAQTLFKGSYIAYSPFNAKFVESGPVVATSPATFNVNMNDKYAHLGDAMFAYGYAPNLVGGQMASAFSFKNLSGLIRVRLSGTLNNVTSVALYDESGKFITSVGLSAQKIMNEGANSTGTALYVNGTAKYTNMLTAEVENMPTNKADVFFSALPTTTGALKVVLYNGDASSDKLAAVYDAEAITVKPGMLTNIEVTGVEAKDFNKRIATSEEALKAMVENNETVTLLGDIELTGSWDLDKDVTIEGGKIIVPSANSSQTVWTISGDATIKSAIEIENAGCCDKYAGKLALGLNAGKAKIALTGTIDNYGEIVTIPATSAANKNVITVAGKVNNHAEYIPEIDETRYATINIVRKTIVELQADLQNDGKFFTEATGNSNEDGTLNIAADATVTNNNEMTNAGNINNRGNINNTKNGWFIDKIGSQVGYKQVTTGEGEYVCEVNGQIRLGDALGANYEGIITRVRFVNNSAMGTATAYDFKELPLDNSDIDFEVAMTDPTKKVTFTSSSKVTLKIGKLYINSGDFEVEYSGKDKGITMFNVVEGIEVNGENAGNVNLAVNTDVAGSVNLVQMANNKKVSIGTTSSGTPVVSAMNVSGDFIVGEATTKAAVSFLNCNTTQIYGNFILNKEGTCTIEVASSTGSDIYAARVWAKDVIENGGKWGNSSTVKIRN